MWKDPWFPCADIVSNIHIKAGWSAYLVEIHKKRAFWAIIFQYLFSLLVKPLHFIFGLLHNPFQGTKLTRWGTLIEQVDIDMIWDGEFALIDSFEKSGFATTVFSKETVSTTISKF